MLIKEPYTKLITTKKKEGEDFRAILSESRQLSEGWSNGYVDNTAGRNFHVDNDLTLHYRTMAGEQKKADMTEFAFTQLCARIGVPAAYVKKCFDSGKEELALENFRRWADDEKGKMLVREQDGVVRAVLSENYKTYDGYQALRNLQHTIDFDRFIVRQHRVTPDNLYIRFVEREPFMTDHNSPLFFGFVITNSDTGKGAFAIRFSIYRQVCTNGLTVQQMGGTLYRQSHVGEGMNGSKLTVLKRCFREMDTLTAATKERIISSRKHNLKDYEVAFYIEKARREMKLSEKATEELKGYVTNVYEPTRWGIINAATELAQRFTLNTRMEMEAWAGDMLAREG